MCLSSMHKRSRTCRVFVMVRFANELSVPLVPGMWTGTYSYVHNPRQHALQLRSSLSTSRTCFADRFDSRSVLLFLAQVSWKRQLLVKYAGRSPNSRACCAGTSNSQSVIRSITSTPPNLLQIRVSPPMSGCASKAWPAQNCLCSINLFLICPIVRRAMEQGTLTLTISSSSLMIQMLCLRRRGRAGRGMAFLLQDES